VRRLRTARTPQFPPRLAAARLPACACPAGDRQCPNHWFEPGFLRAFSNAFTPFLGWYFRPAIVGAERLPHTRPAILVMNHSGMSFPWDALLLVHAVMHACGGERRWMTRPLAIRELFALPGLNQLALRLGVWPVSGRALEQLLEHGELVLHFPEGLAGLSKGWARRYRLRSFHTGAFRAAARLRVPVVPVACVGAEGFNPFALNLASVGRAFGIPMFPLSPLQLLLYPHFVTAFPWVLPSRVTFHIGEAIAIPEGAGNDPRVLREMAWQARRTVQDMLDAYR
jgi:1-acyl-sn-glycerol-3-phosphate acyltransferase